MSTQTNPVESVKVIIESTSSLKANGWAPVIRHTNGAIEVLAARHETMGDAERHSRALLKAYERRPDLVPDIPPHTCFEWKSEE